MTNAIVAAIVELNPAASIESHGAYLRISVPDRCIVTRAAIEAHLGSEFRFPGDLEANMPSFAGRLKITDSAACWFGAEAEE